MTQQPEDRPAVEFGATDEDDEGLPTWQAVGPLALLLGAVTIALLVPGVWEEHVADYEGRRVRGLVNLVESFGHVPTVTVLGVLAVLTLAVSARSLLTEMRNDKEND